MQAESVGVSNKLAIYSREDLSRWHEKIEKYFSKEGFVPIDVLSFKRRVPKKIREMHIDLVDDKNANSGFGPPRYGDIRKANNAKAHYLDDFLAVTYVAELETLRFLATHIEAVRPQTVVDAGCGTGLDLGFLVSQFDSDFIGYDISENMIGCAGPRIFRHCLNRDKVRLFTASHVQAASRIKRASADLVIAKCSIDEVGLEIDFSQAASPALAREFFFKNDPVFARLRRHAKAFFSMLKPGGGLILINSAENPDSLELMNEAAFQAGFFEVSVNTSFTTPASGPVLINIFTKSPD